MPTIQKIFNRIKNNDPTLTTVNLRGKHINDSDISDLALALKTNSTLAGLDLGANFIGPDGAK